VNYPRDYDSPRVYKQSKCPPQSISEQINADENASELNLERVEL